jgi:hypothetical protein
MTDKMYQIYDGEFYEVWHHSLEDVKYTHLGTRLTLNITIVVNDELKKFRYIDGYDEINIFYEIDMKAFVHRFLSVKSSNESCYLMGGFYKNVKFEVQNDIVTINAEAWSVDGNFGMEEFEENVSYIVPLDIVKGTKAEIEAYLRGVKL